MADGPSPATLARLLRRRISVGDLWIRTGGDSMGRTIVGGTQVRIRSMDRGPRVGEVWAFVTASGELTVHRCLRRTRSGRYVFVGDASSWADRPIDRSLIVGRVIDGDGPMSVWRLGRLGSVGPLVRAVGRGGLRRLRRR